MRYEVMRWLLHITVLIVSLSAIAKAFMDLRRTGIAAPAIQVSR